MLISNYVRSLNCSSKTANNSNKSDRGRGRLTMRKRLCENNSGDETRCEFSGKRFRSESPELDVYLEIFPEPVATDDKKNVTLTRLLDDNRVPSELPEVFDIKAEPHNQLGNSGTTIAQDHDTKITIKEEQDIEIKVEPLEASKDLINEDHGHRRKIKSEMINEEEDTASLIVSRIQDEEVADVSELSILTVCKSRDDKASSSESEEQQDSPQSPEPIVAEVKPIYFPHKVVGSLEADESKIDHRNAESAAKNANRTVKSKLSDKQSSPLTDISLTDSNSNKNDYSSRNSRMFQKTGSCRDEQQSTKKRISDSKEDVMLDGKGGEMSPSDQASEESRKNLNRVMAKGKSDSKREDECQSQPPSNDKNNENGTRKNTKNTGSMKENIRRMKKYLTTAGIRVKYAKLWSGCNFDAERVDRMKELLQEKGLDGKPNLEKCRKLKLKNERLKDAAELDTRNIISQERITRARRGEIREINVPIVASAAHRNAQIFIKRLQLLCSSDTE